MAQNVGHSKDFPPHPDGRIGQARRAEPRRRASVRRWRRLILVWLVVLAVWSLAACGHSQPTPAAAEPTPSATPGVALAPTDSPAASPTAMRVNVAELTANTALPDNVAPFTGLTAPDPAKLKRMPAAVKISNSPIARPQSGLSKADVVIEHLAEGGITRFTAIYHSEDAERIGSVRSARLIDLEIPVLFDAFLVYSGASGEVTRLLDNSDFAQYTLSDERQDPGFYRLAIPGRAYEHTLFTDTELLQQVARERGWTKQPRSRGWTWSEQPAKDAQPAAAIDIPYSNEWSDVHYEYDATTGAYKRSILGQPHIDSLTGEQLAADNVVVLYVNHVPTLIVEDVLGSKSVEIQLWGQGRMQLFRNGVVEEGVWARPQREDPLLFLDPNFKALPLKPGKTWIQIVPLDMQVTVGR